MKKLDRRQFLELAAVSVAAGTLGLGCDDGSDDAAGGFGEASAQADIDQIFSLGLASGDPKPSSVILWTRVAEAGPVDYEIATDQGFSELIASGTVEASEASDFTVRVKATELEPGTTYWYRFRAAEVVSDWGRTRTAPAPDADEAVRFAFASCQDYNGRYYHAWSVLTDREDVDFVAFLGDWIYETANDPRFQETSEDRSVTVPDGLALDEDGESLAALTLADYRALHRQYASDPQLKEARRRYPFINIWDDHEFADDCWQDHATHFNGAKADEGDEQDTDRRTAANRAWFEYVPVDLEHDATKQYPEDIRIYRSLRFGKHVDLICTDGRSYRDDHLIPEGPPNNDVGKFLSNSSLGARQFLLKSGFDTLEAEAKPTLLGETQKAWLLDKIGSSEATWKVWAQQVMHGQMTVDLSDVEALPASFKGHFYLTVDQWDGFRSERAEILEAFAEVDNVLVLTGDLHANYANELYTDFDDPGDPVAVEFVTAGISSRSIQEIIEAVVESNELLSTLGLEATVAELDSRVMAVGPHHKYVKNKAYGISLVTADAEGVAVSFLDINSPTSPTFDGEITEVKFTVAVGSNRIERA